MLELIDLAEEAQRLADRVLVLAGFWSRAIGWPAAGSGERWSSLRSASAQGPYLEFIKVEDPELADPEGNEFCVPLTGRRPSGRPSGPGPGSATRSS